MAKADLGAWAVLVRYASSPIWHVAGHQVPRRSATERNLCFVYYLESECDYCGLTMHKCTNARALETWYKVPWLHAPSRAYAHMSCT
jgi:phage-related protein